MNSERSFRRDLQRHWQIAHTMGDAGKKAAVEKTLAARFAASTVKKAMSQLDAWAEKYDLEREMFAVEQEAVHTSGTDLEEEVQ